MTDLRIAKDRLLYMYSRLVDGKMLYKKEEAQRFGCSLRSIQRDIEDLRSFLHEQNEASGLVQDLVYNQKLGAYQLVPPSRNLLSNEEVFATLKILLESRAFTKKELYPIIDKLIDCCIPKTEQQRVSELIGNEKLLYVEPQHKDKFLNSKRFEEGEFRKRIQFMYGGHLQRLRFLFKGGSYEYILDRLPTAKVVEESENGTLIEAEVFGKGIDIWLKSQGELIEVISRQEIPVN